MGRNRGSNRQVQKRKWTSTSFPLDMVVLTIFKKHGRLKIFLDWRNNAQDYECLYHGMQKADRLYLLPPRPKGPERPLSWWCTLRKRLNNVGLSVLPLGLGHLHRIIYTQQTGLFSKMAQCRCGCNHDNTSDQCLLLQPEKQPNTREAGKLLLSHLSKTRYETQRMRG